MSNLSGKTALVTGASRGIGRASALALAKAGAQVLVHYSISEKEADAVVAEIRKTGGRAEKVGADLRQADGPHILAKRVRAIVGDRLDILAANAGISKAASIEDTKIEDFDNLFAVNVRARRLPHHHRGPAGFPHGARPDRHRAAGITQPDHKAHHEVLDAQGLSHRRAGHELSRRPSSRRKRAFEIIATHPYPSELSSRLF